MGDRHIKRYKQVNIKLDYERDQDVIKVLDECENKHNLLVVLIRIAFQLGGDEHDE